jgi:hypothetical protein
MAPMTEPQRAGVLVVSLWLEGSGEALRARVTETSDVNAVGETTKVVGSLEELLGAVEDWARGFHRPPTAGWDGLVATEPAVEVAPGTTE